MQTHKDFLIFLIFTGILLLWARPLLLPPWRSWIWQAQGGSSNGLAHSRRIPVNIRKITKSLCVSIKKLWREVWLVCAVHNIHTRLLHWIYASLRQSWIWQAQGGSSNGLAHSRRIPVNIKKIRKSLCVCIKKLWREVWLLCCSQHPYTPTALDMCVSKEELNLAGSGWYSTMT